MYETQSSLKLINIQTKAMSTYSVERNPSFGKFTLFKNILALVIWEEKNHIEFFRFLF